jgi:hypothetical protein
LLTAPRSEQSSLTAFRTAVGHYKSLAEAMSRQAGEPKESTQALTNKVNRGRFSFAFFLRACRAMGVVRVDLSDLPKATN